MDLGEISKGRGFPLECTCISLPTEQTGPKIVLLAFAIFCGDIDQEN